MAQRFFVADFETTSPKSGEEKDFTETEVWGAGITEVGSDSEEQVKLFGSIRDFFDYCKTIEGKKPIIFFHNLKFDGVFIIDYLLRYMHFTISSNPFKQERNEFYAMISKDGTYYSIRVNFQGKNFEFRDSLKLLPFKVEEIAKQLGTKHQKLVGSIDYRADRKLTWECRGGKWFKHYEMNETEKRYLTNDILVMSEALEMIRPYGLLNYLTIASCCLDDFKKRVSSDKFYEWFVNLGELDAEFRKAYHGGWCFVKNPGQEHNCHGYVYDVNSLYPYAMSGVDNHYFPCGKPVHFKGEDFFKFQNNCYFIKVRVDFQIKPDHLPFIQVKDSFYQENKYLTDTLDDEGYPHMLEFVFTRPDFELFLEQYDIIDIQYIEGWAFVAKLGIFDTYINYWYDIKKNAKNKVERQIAKLHLNSLYGKLCVNPVGFSHIPYLDEYEKLQFDTVEESRKPIDVAVGAFVTSYARCYTIRAAQANYNTFQYADTDSIHLTGEAKDIRVGKELGEWKLETEFSKAKFARQKTYIEKTIKEDGEDVEPYWNIKACGCPDEPKERMLFKVDLFEPLTKDTNGVIINDRRSDEEFMKRFDVGLVESGKLQQKRIKGGVILIDSTFEIKPI